MESAEKQVIREIVTDGVGTARPLASDAQLDDDELFERCFVLRGEPYGEACARRDMRERIRVFQRIRTHGAALPKVLGDMLELWAEAMRGEVRLYKEAETAQFRQLRIPFAHRANPFEYAEPPAGRETVEASRIPHEPEALMAFMGRTDLPLEILAAASHFLCGHIHPFSDGNSRLSRMLACINLSGGYSSATVLSMLRRLQCDRGAMNLEMMRTVRLKADLEAVVGLFLNMLCAAQRDLLPARKGFARLPLRSVQTDDLELVSARKPDREVYRMRDGDILKTVAGKGRLGRACAVYEAVSAAFDAGAAIARPGELVRTGNKYAITYEFVKGASLKDLVVRRLMSPEDAGEMMARCLRGLHALHGDEERMRDVREPFLRMVDNIAPWLSERTVEACRLAVMDVPYDTTLVHGDVHMDNMIVDGNGELVLIDAGTISMGHPVFDLACTYHTLVCEAAIDPARAEAFHDMPIEDVACVWQSLLSCYDADAGKACFGSDDCRMEALAWIVMLNRLKSSGRSDASFGEGALQVLHAIQCLSDAVSGMQNSR